MLLQLPLEGVLRGGGIAAVLKRPPGADPEWLTGPHRRDIFVSFAEARSGWRALVVCPAEAPMRCSVTALASRLALQ